MRPRLEELILDAAKDGFKIETRRQIFPRGWSTVVSIQKNGNPFCTSFLDISTDTEVENGFLKIKEAAEMHGPLRVRVVRRKK